MGDLDDLLDFTSESRLWRTVAEITGVIAVGLLLWAVFL